MPVVERDFTTHLVKPIDNNITLEVRDLVTAFQGGTGVVRAVDGISLGVPAGKTLCIVGESGCGKSVTALSIMGLLPDNARIESGEIVFRGQDLAKLPDDVRRRLRGSELAMIFQEPMTALNPAYTIGNQLMEVHLLHRGGGVAKARERAIELLGKVGIASAAERLEQYPHQLSGGLRQRVMIAMALMCGPELLIADEPSTALDVTIQAQILRLLADLQKDLGIAMVLITHDLGVVARIAHRVAVMYAGEIVEEGTAERVFASPRHPYTRGLISCIPVPGRTERGGRLGTIAGVVPSLIGEIRGCSFRERCMYAQPECAATVPLRRRGEHRWRCIHEDLPA